MHTQPLLLHITQRHNGKMTNMQSLSTSCMGNDTCAKLAQVEGSVCQKCYANKMMRMYRHMNECFSKNAEILANINLEEHRELIPQINASYFRFEAFGDLINEQHLKNFFTICNANEDTHFALWTKNPQIIANVIKEGISKPDNLQIIVSSIFLNTPAEFTHTFIDKIFTVYDKQHKDDAVINCGKKKCIDCKLCYRKNNVKYINELLK